MANMADILWQKELKNRKLVYVDIFDGYDGFFEHCRLYDAMNRNSLETMSSKNNMVSMAMALKAKSVGLDTENLETAVQKTNKSLCFAETGCEEVGLAYSLRADFFFQLKQYSLSLAGVELAKNNGYPPILRSLLDQRKDKYLKSMDAAAGGTSPQLAKVPKLSFAADEKIQCFAQGLEVKHSKEFGKHIITNRKLEIGQTVIVEEAYCITAENDQNYSQCANCFERKANLIPCQNCSDIMFCSRICYDVGHEKFHAIECGKPAVYFKWNAAIRIVTQSIIKAIKAFPNVKGLMDVIEKYINRKPNSNMNYDNPSIRAYMQFFGLSESTRLTSVVQNLIFLEHTKAIHSQIISNPTYEAMFRSDETRCFLAHLIMHHFHVGNLNGFKVVSRLHGAYINELGLDSENRGGLLYAYGIFLNSCQLKHSCQPNIARIFFGNKAKSFDRSNVASSCMFRTCKLQ